MILFLKSAVIHRKIVFTLEINCAHFGKKRLEAICSAQWPKN